VACFDRLCRRRGALSRPPWVAAGPAASWRRPLPFGCGRALRLVAPAALTAGFGSFGRRRGALCRPFGCRHGPPTLGVGCFDSLLWLFEPPARALLPARGTVWPGAMQCWLPRWSFPTAPAAGVGPSAARYGLGSRPAPTAFAAGAGPSAAPSGRGTVQRLAVHAASSAARFAAGSGPLPPPSGYGRARRLLVLTAWAACFGSLSRRRGPSAAR